MRAICLGAMLLLLSTVSAPAKDADFLNSLWGDPQGQYGSWSVLVTQNGATKAKLYQIVSADLGIVALVSASDEEPMVVRASGHDLRSRSLKVRVDRNRPLNLGSGSERSRDLLRQMLDGKQIVVEYTTAEGVRQYHRASLDGFAAAWKRAAALVRNLDSAPAYLYEPCDDDQFCLANTFCETGTAYCSTVTQTCQCTQPNPGGGTGCVHPGCGYGQVFNAAACTCECSAVYCEPPQVQDPMTCACGCPDPGCPVPQMWNHGTCTCTCLNSGTICRTNTVWNPTTCECEPVS